MPMSHKQLLTGCDPSSVRPSVCPPLGFRTLLLLFYAAWEPMYPVTFTVIYAVVHLYVDLLRSVDRPMTYTVQCSSLLSFCFTHSLTRLPAILVAAPCSHLYILASFPGASVLHQRAPGVQENVLATNYLPGYLASSARVKALYRLHATWTCIRVSV